MQQNIYIIKRRIGIKMKKKEFETVNAFGLGNKNESYDKYFIGESYLIL